MKTMKPLVIKLGGVLLDTPQAMENLFTALAEYQQHFARPLLIVHGGGCVVDELMQRLDLPVKRKMACGLPLKIKLTSSLLL